VFLLGRKFLPKCVRILFDVVNAALFRGRQFVPELMPSLHYVLEFMSLLGVEAFPEARGVCFEMHQVRALLERQVVPHLFAFMNKMCEGVAFFTRQTGGESSRLSEPRHDDDIFVFASAFSLFFFSSFLCKD
jgi:hypothetical protein